MPKIIKDVKENIFKTAAKLFCQQDYDDVEMRHIAKKCGIAVGTLYNYYSNKKELYIDIIDTSWNETFGKLKTVDESRKPIKDKIREYIQVLYRDMECRRGLCKSMFKSNYSDIIEDERICRLKNKIFQEVIALIKQTEKQEKFSDDTQLDDKIAETLLVSMVILIETHGNDEQNNIDYLCQMVNAFIK